MAVNYLQKKKVNHCSKTVTLTVYSLCRLSNYFWSVDIKFWMMVAIMVEFNVTCNVGTGQLSGHVPPYVYRITLQAAIRIAIRANRRLYGRKVVCPMVIFKNCCFNSNYSASICVISISDADMASIW